MLRKVTIYCLAIIGFSFGISDSQTNTAVSIKNKSLLSISGTTNINSFECNFNTNELVKPIQINFTKKDDKLVFDKAILQLYYGYFDCGGKAINKDFKELIKAQDHPKINLRLKEIHYSDNADTKIKAIIAIELAGVTKNYETPIQVKQNTDIYISGNLVLDINDFNLEAPKKAFGLIVVNNMIDINFDLRVQENN